MTKKDRSGHLLIVTALGFFALAAQTLLFRNFLGIYEGNELGVGAFFSSWLIWVALGALLARIPTRALDRASTQFDLLTLLYLPAFVIQQQLILHSRELAGIEPFELFPFTKMFAVSLLTNGPVSLCTGFLFSLACRWVASHDRSIPVARVYMFEALGSCVAGVLVTLLLGLGMAGETVFFYASLGPLVSLLIYRLSAKQHVTAWIPAAFVIACLATGVDHRLQDANDARSWQRLLPAESYQGRFATAQARYLYGAYRGQFSVMAWESITENMPNKEYASEIAAIHLAQKPDAERVLVIGPGSYALCKRLLDVGQIEEVIWLHPDQEYPAALSAILPRELRITSGRFQAPAMEARAFIREQGSRFDLAILNLPEDTTLVLNRYFTQEFFGLLRTHLADDAVIGIRSSGGENFMGDELSHLGSSIALTLRSAFEHIALKPGDETWFLASTIYPVEQDPELLTDRFASMANASDLYPPAGLFSLYVDDRAQFQWEKYSEVLANQPVSGLLNTDRQPKALLHSLLFVGQHAGPSNTLSEHLSMLNSQGPTWYLIAIGIFLIMRFVYVYASPGRRTQGNLSSFDCGLLVLTTGGAGLSLNMVLMLLFQTHYGSLYLFIGFISSLFMLGIFTGSFITERSIRRHRRPSAFLLPVGLLLHVLFTLLLIDLAPELPKWVFAALFFVAGGLGGLYIPVAGFHLQQANFSERAIGSRVETFDHMGGALGALLTGLILLPAFGITMTLVGLAALLAINLPFLLVSNTGKGSERKETALMKTLRIASCLALGIILIPIATRLTTAQTVRSSMPGASLGSLGTPAVKTLTETAEEPAESTHAYQTWTTAEGKPGYKFSTEGLAEGVKGFAGPIVLRMHVDEDGQLHDFEVVSSQDTPAYFDLALTWAKKLKGLNVFDNTNKKGLDGITGATISSIGIRDTIFTAAQNFRDRVIKETCATDTLTAPTAPPPEGQTRKANIPAIKKRISERDLSDHEALHYKGN